MYIRKEETKDVNVKMLQKKMIYIARYIFQEKRKKMIL